MTLALNELGEYYHRDLSGGRYVAVIPLTFGRARLIVGKGMTYDDGW